MARASAGMAPALPCASNSCPIVIARRAASLRFLSVILNTSQFAVRLYAVRLFPTWENLSAQRRSAAQYIPYLFSISLYRLLVKSTKSTEVYKSISYKQFAFSTLSEAYCTHLTIIYALAHREPGIMSRSAAAYNKLNAGKRTLVPGSLKCSALNVYHMLNTEPLTATP